MKSRLHWGLALIFDDDSVQAVLRPVGDGGVGVDGRLDEAAAGDAFRELRSQRKSIFRHEQRAAMGKEDSEDEAWTWPVLAEEARDYLTQHAKDFEVMAMLVESAARVDGMAGLERGVHTMRAFVEQWWEQGLYPVEDEEDGIEARFQPLSGLSGGSGDKDGTLVMPLRRMVLAGDTVNGQLVYFDKVSADALVAAATSGAADQRAGRTAEAQAMSDAAAATARRLGGKALRPAIARLETVETDWRAMVSYISERTKPRFPSASRVTDELRGMRDWLASLLKLLPDDLPVEDALQDADDAAGAPLANGAAAPAGGPFVIGQITKRDDALRAVTAAAEYFDRFEPLSPLGSTLREVDRRARLSLDALLEELIPDATVRQTYYWRSGIRPPEGAA